MNLSGNEFKIKVPASAAIIKKISQTHCAIQKPYPDKKSGAGSDPCKPPCGKNQITLALPSEAICCRGAQLADTQFTCTTEGCTQASKHGQQTSIRSDPKSDFPNRDTFVLKVVKNALQGDRKCKLELELVAPKAGEKRLPVQKVNMKMQSDPKCGCCPARRSRLKKRACR